MEQTFEQVFRKVRSTLRPLFLKAIELSSSDSDESNKLFTQVEDEQKKIVEESGHDMNWFNDNMSKHIIDVSEDDPDKWTFVLDPDNAKIINKK